MSELFDERPNSHEQEHEARAGVWVGMETLSVSTQGTPEAGFKALTLTGPSPQTLCWNAASPVCSSLRRDGGSARTRRKRRGWLKGALAIPFPVSFPSQNLSGPPCSLAPLILGPLFPPPYTHSPLLPLTNTALDPNNSWKMDVTLLYFAEEDTSPGSGSLLVSGSPPVCPAASPSRSRQRWWKM